MTAQMDLIIYIGAAIILGIVLMIVCGLLTWAGDRDKYDVVSEEEQ